jgi:hypothetical protein
MDKNLTMLVVEISKLTFLSALSDLSSSFEQIGGI